MKKIIITSMFILGACGTEKGSDDSSQTAQVIDSASNVIEKTDEETNNTSSQPDQIIQHPKSAVETKSFSGHAKLVETMEDLQACAEESKGFLVYVKEQEKFHYCDLDIGWVPIELAGENGQDGKDGIDGQDGKDGQDGRDILVQDNEWIHPITKERYALFVGPGNARDLTGKKICPEGTTLPARDEGSHQNGVIPSTEISSAFYHFNRIFIYDFGKVSGTGSADDGKLYISRIENNGGFQWEVDSDGDGQFRSTAHYPVLCKILEDESGN